MKLLLLIFCCVTSFTVLAQGAKVVDSTARPVITFSTLPQANKTQYLLPQDFYAQHLPFFCKQELKLQRVNVPLMFRVGSVSQSNWLEQKPGYKMVVEDK